MPLCPHCVCVFTLILSIRIQQNPELAFPFFLLPNFQMVPFRISLFLNWFRLLNFFGANPTLMGFALYIFVLFYCSTPALFMLFCFFQNYNCLRITFCIFVYGNLEESKRRNCELYARSDFQCGKLIFKLYFYSFLRLPLVFQIFKQSSV